jgi:putative transposase
MAHWRIQPHEHRSDEIGARRRLRDFDYKGTAATYFITICARHDTSPFLDSRLARVVVQSLEWLRSDRGVNIYAYCLMPDHLHILMRLGDEEQTLSGIIGAFKSFTTRESWKRGWRGELWQARFYDHVLRANEDVEQIGLYILQNPVRNGLVQEPDAYAWSGVLDPL